MWHSQTPGWFFKESYSGSQNVTSDVMDARLEFYVRTMITHVLEKEKELTGEYGSIVYAWDVTNEYLHRSKSTTTWTDVYGDLGMEPTYVKKAYETAYDVLKTYGVQDKVTLFYNDYDTYFEVEDVVKLVNYINEGEEANICGGIGMQSHVDVDRPTLEQYKTALETFLSTGLEVQVTELDVTINFDHQSTYQYKNENQTDEDQAKFVKELMELLVSTQKNRDTNVSPKGITGVTIWGLYDSCSWRSECSPLLFGTSINDPKASYYAFLEAAGK
jgi:GH35 family endo-1,4-beta-xylanase